VRSPAAPLARQGTHLWESDETLALREAGTSFAPGRVFVAGPWWVVGTGVSSGGSASRAQKHGVPNPVDASVINEIASEQLGGLRRFTRGELRALPSFLHAKEQVVVMAVGTVGRRRR
jgi:hypothetical protein